MAGHSKWANIKHTKAKVDAKRGKIFTKLIRAITVAARAGGAELESNSQLRLAVDKANAANMPKDTIQRAIKRGAGLDNGSELVEIRYEGYAPFGVAVIVDCLTDNKNRTVADVRHAFTKYGGNLGTDGSVAYLFNKNGLITFAPGCHEEKVMEIALEHAVIDILSHEDGSVDVLTEPDHFTNVCDALTEKNLTPASAEISLIATTEVDLNKEQAEKIAQLIDMLEDLDDVQSVYSNANYEE